MPISTLFWVSMPSTYSRKPCTKCWRDISPSQTTSMPASSCSLSILSAASSLPCVRSAPSSRHFGHSLSGSASQDGLGRLPAMVVGKSMNPPCYYWRTISSIARVPRRGRRRRPSAPPPVIDPVVALEQPFAAEHAHHDIAHCGFRAGAAVDRALLSRGCLCACGAAAAKLLIGAKARFRSRAVLLEFIGQHGGVLDRHAGALREEGQHRVR